jgi:hypothetical protein
MKKLALTLAIVLGLGMTTFADGGGLFQRGNTPEQENAYFKNGDRVGGFPGFPAHGGNSDADAPLGTGIVLLAGLGAAYLVGKKRREE